MNKNIIKISINQKIKELRLRNNLTQKGFAEKIGTTRAALGQIETFVANPTLELVIRIVKEFNITYEELIDGVDRVKEQTHNQAKLIENEQLRKELELKDEIIANQKLLIKALNKNIEKDES